MSAVVHRLRVRNAAQVVTVCSRGERVLRGTEMGQVAVLEGGGLGIVVDSSGKIAAVGRDTDIDTAMKGGRGKFDACAVRRYFQGALLIT